MYDIEFSEVITTVNSFVFFYIYLYTFLVKLTVTVIILARRTKSLIILIYMTVYLINVLISCQSNHNLGYFYSYKFTINNLFFFSLHDNTHIAELDILREAPGSGINEP